MYHLLKHSWEQHNSLDSHLGCFGPHVWLVKVDILSLTALLVGQQEGHLARITFWLNNSQKFTFGDQHILE